MCLAHQITRILQLKIGHKNRLLVLLAAILALMQVHLVSWCKCCTSIRTKKSNELWLRPTTIQITLTRSLVISILCDSICAVVAFCSHMDDSSHFEMKLSKWLVFLLLSWISTKIHKRQFDITWHKKKKT